MELRFVVVEVVVPLVFVDERVDPYPDDPEDPDDPEVPDEPVPPVPAP